MYLFLLFFTLFTIWILYGQLKTKNDKLVDNNHLLERLTVVVPFRNEYHHLPQLLNSIKTQNQPHLILFVNDHSEDESLKVFEKFELENIEVISLEAENGKKEAIRKAIEISTTDYILTLDADVVLPNDYFSNLSRILLKDAHILPVRISNHPFFDFFNLDYYYLYALNNGWKFWRRPFHSSGANFLFKRELFIDYIKSDDNQNISSGDDIYFLNFLNDKRCEVETNTSVGLATETQFSNVWSEIIAQRVRWIKKSSSFKNLNTFILGVLGLTYHFGFLILFIFHYENLFGLLITKIVFDWLLFYPYLSQIGERISLWKIALFSILYPFWVFFILITSLIYTPKWKLRKVVVK